METLRPVDGRSHDPESEFRHNTRTPKPVPKGKFRALGLGLITGASDDDPTAAETYASAGAAFGPAILWVVPLAYPMMVIVSYLSSKLGQVAGQHRGICRRVPTVGQCADRPDR